LTIAMTHSFEPPTVRQPKGPGRPDELRLPGNEPPTSLQRTGGSRIGESATTLQRRAGSPEDPPTRLQRPEGRQRPESLDGVLGELADRFEPVPGPDGGARLGSGAEAEVWLVRDREQDRLAALKLYRPDPLLDLHETFDVTLRERLADPALRAYVPGLYGWGWARAGYGREVAWEAMEYFELGSLTDLIQREAPGGRLRPERAAEVVREIVNALVFWEDVVQERQIDLSPGNILVRRAAPLDLVLSDFGGVRGTGLSQAIGELQVKVGYMAPEALGNGNHSKSPYWSFGMICYQLVMGRSVISDRNEDAFRIILATNDIDASAVTDPRWRLLIEGLLTRSIDERWGPDQVREWLVGGSPDVHRSVRSARPAQTLGFAGKQFDDRRLLAGEMISEADRAAEWLKDGGAAKLRTWLATFDDHPFDIVHLSGAERDEWRAHLAVSWFAAAFLRDQRPHFRGMPIDLDGILRLAQDPGSRGFLHQLLDRDVLRIAALHDCSHPRCTGGPCLELRDLGRRIAGAAAQAMDQLNALGPRLAGDSLAADVFGTESLVQPRDIERFYARAAEVLVSPERAERIAETIRRGRLPRAGWWQDIAHAATQADHRTADGAAAICVAAELTDRAQAYRRAEDRRRRMTAQQRTTAVFSWIGQQFTRNPSGRQHVFASPRWIPRLLLFLIPIACFEPVYWGAVYAHQRSLNPSVMKTADQAMQSMQSYTRWSSDWLTPWLLAHWQTQPWKVYAAYPVVMILALAFIRRTRRGSAARSWLALPATIIGLIFAIGLIMHLLSEDLYAIWATFAALSIAAFLAPLASLIAVRIVAGRNR
jgi:Protein kinase domain